jgi:HlyD family secretion protein
MTLAVRRPTGAAAMNVRQILFGAVVTIVPTSMIGVHLVKQTIALHADANGSGVIEGTEITLSSRISARVVEVPVHEGQAVNAGDLLVRLDCTETEAQHAAAVARLNQAIAQSEAAHAQADAAGQSAGAARHASAAGRSTVDALTSQRDIAAKQAARLDAQREDVAVASLEQAEASADALAHQADAARAQATASGLQAGAATDQARAATAQASAADALIDAARADLARVELLVGECEIRAPRAALVETLPWDPGEMVPPGGIVANLVDITTVKATFYLPDAELAAAKPGQQAVIVADAYADRTFAGSVTTIATTAEFTPRNVQTRTDRDRLVFPIEVSIPNEAGLLRPGMPVDITLPGTGR